MFLPLLIATQCYLTDPTTHYCITGVSPHMIILPKPHDDSKEVYKDRHIDLQAELSKLQPTDPACKPPYDKPCQ